MSLKDRFEGLTVGALLTHRATIDPECPFLLVGDSALSVGEVDSTADALAASLSNLGLGSGDRIAVVLPDCSEFVVTMFAAAKLGLTLVPLDPELAPADLQFALRQSEAIAAICVETFNGIDYLARFEDLMAQLPALRYLATVGEEELWHDDRIFQFEDLVSAGAGRDYATGDVGHEDVFAIVYTSGTTGKPKGVELTHRGLIYTAMATSEVVELDSHDRIAGLSGLSHAFGLGPGLLGSLASGASLHLDRGTGPPSILDEVERLRVTVLFGVPTLFASLVRDQSEAPRDVSSLRLGVSAGAPSADDLVRDVEEVLDTTLLTSYTLIEAGSTVAIARAGDSDEQRRQTVGRPLEGTEIEVFAEDGSLLPVESVGEIAVRGPGLMRGYFRQPRETSRVVNDAGFLRTGDVGMLDDSGFVHLVGRRHDVIIRSGFNVHPREVEERLLAHPAVDDAAVVGVADSVLGEAVVACIIPVEGAIVSGPELQDWCGVMLTDRKVPDSVRFLESFPRTATGAIRRVELARRLREADSKE